MANESKKSKETEADKILKIVEEKKVTKHQAVNELASSKKKSSK